MTTTKTWQRTGPAAAGFEAVDVLPALTQKAVEFVAAQAKKDKPFFLYMPLNSPHTPIVPSKAWQGKSSVGAYGDFVMETDWAVGEVLAALDKAAIGGNTLVILTSDNGCSKAAGIPKLQEQGHYPSGDMRGSKADIFDGGHRIPFIARWPDKIKAGSRCAHTICQIDLMATCADIAGFKLPDNAGEDSLSILPALLGEDQAPVHEAVVHHSINGSFAIRPGKWKLELCADSGGWSDPKPGSAEAKGLPVTQLYDHCSQTFASDPVSLESLLRELIDRDSVARFPKNDFRLKQNSSHNRASKTPDEEKGWFNNKDNNTSENDKNFVRVEENNGDKEWVLMEDEGPGAIVRTWMPFPSAGTPDTNSQRLG